MKKFLLAPLVCLRSLVWRLPRSAADMAVKTAAPPIVAPITVGAASMSVPTAAGVRATSAGILRTSFSLSPPPSVKVVTMRTAEWLAVRSDTVGRPAIGCSAWKRRATGPILRDLMLVVSFPPWTNNSKIEAFGLFTGQVGYAWNNVLWYVKGGAAVTDDKYRGTVHRQHHASACSIFMRVKRAGVVSSERASNSDSHRTGQLRSSTIIFSWVIANHASYREASWVPLSTGLAAVFRTNSIGQDVDIVTARINYRFGRPARPVVLISFLSPVNFEAPATSGAFFGTPRVRGTFPSQGRCEGAVMRPASATAPAPRAGIRSAGQREGGRYQ